MIYQEFNTNINGLEQRLGLLGEVHIYSQKESELAQEIVKKYTRYCSEGDEIYTTLDKILNISFALPRYALMTKNRNTTHDTAFDIAIDNNLEILYLGDDVSTAKKVGLIGIGTIATILSPAIAIICQSDNLLFGDVHSEGTSASRLRKKIHLPLFADRLADVKKRDLQMGDKIIEYLTIDTSPLLANVGQGHVPGIIAHLQERIELTEEYKICL